MSSQKENKDSLLSPTNTKENSDVSDEESDADYVPSGHESASEEENSGDDEGFTAQNEQLCNKKRKHFKKNLNVISNPRLKRRADNSIDEENEELKKNIAADGAALKEKQEKCRSDALWATFIADVNKPKPKTTTTTSTNQVSPTNHAGGSSLKTNKLDGKVKITKIFDFAGEEVRMEEEVDAHSKEAKAATDKTQIRGQSSTSFASGSKKPGGLGAVLGYINKKQKINVLDKSKLDWEKYKAEANIGEDLAHHNRGKNSYLEKKEFLERADQRQFEIERDFRLSKSSKR